MRHWRSLCELLRLLRWCRLQQLLLLLLLLLLPLLLSGAGARRELECRDAARRLCCCA